MIYNFGNNSSILNQYMTELRDVVIQRDAMRFRKNLERVATLMAYEISKTFEYKTVEVTTSLGEASCQVLTEQPILATILRAGLAMHNGFLNCFDKADSAFISAYRKHSKIEKFEVYVEYVSSPPIDDRILIITDPMLATGSSMSAVYRALREHGTPKRMIICCAVASKEAIEYIQKNIPFKFDLYVGAVDDELTAQSYIVPGLGDAGDLAYGVKK